MEIKSAKTSSEFAKGIKGDDYIESEVDEILSTIPETPGDITKIDELITLAEQTSENAKGGNKKCFIHGDNALLYGTIDEKNMQALIQLTQDLKSRGVSVARTLDYKITEGTKGYSLQEKAGGTPLHNRVRWNAPKEEIPMEKQIYTDRLKELSGESQEFYDKFVQDWLAIQDAGIRIDPSKMDNFYYEQGKGITFIDLDAGVGKVDEKAVDLKTVCHEMSTILAGSGKYWRFGNDEEIAKAANKSLSPIFKKFAKSMEKAGLPMKEIKTILKDHYPDVDLTDPMKKFEDPTAPGKTAESFEQEGTNSSSFKKTLETPNEQKKINTSSLKASLESAKVKTGEVKRSEQEIAERNEYKKLLVQKSRGLTPEQQARYDMLYAKYYMTPEEKQQQGQKKGMGMSM